MLEYRAEWAGAERAFRLPYRQMLDLEEACGQVGIGALASRIVQRRFFARDVRAVIKHGLIGGGTAPAEAERLVSERMEAAPFEELVALAVAILAHAMTGPPNRGE